jgi:carbonic anhydrase
MSVDAMIPAPDALRRLREGNARFVAQVRGDDPYLSHMKRFALTIVQRPFAIILGCADSRVPAEIVFDQGLGDLFVIRVAGNIVAPSLVGSVEFAAARFETRLVVVLGHSQCGAIAATLEVLRDHHDVKSLNLRSIADAIRPSVEPLLAKAERLDDEALAHEATRANIRNSVDHLRHGSALLEGLVRDAGLLVVGAEYSVETGIVEFLGDETH